MYRIDIIFNKNDRRLVFDTVTSKFSDKNGYILRNQVITKEDADFILSIKDSSLSILCPEFTRGNTIEDILLLIENLRENICFSIISNCFLLPKDIVIAEEQRNIICYYEKRNSEKKIS